MTIVDISAYPRIPVLLEMARRMSRSKEPDEVLGAYIHGMLESYRTATMVRVGTFELPPGQFRLLFVGEPRADDHIEDPEEWPEFPVQEGGFLGAMTRTPEPKLVTGLRLEQDPVLGDDFARYRGALAVPAYLGGQTAQWLVLLHEDEADVTVERLEDFVVHINMLYSNVRAAVIARQLRAATRWIKNEVQIIADIQRALLPPEIPDIPLLVGAAHYETFEQAGGDYYDFRPLRTRDGQRDPDGPWAMIVADAAGHGPAAAVVMAMMRTLFHGFEETMAGPDAILEYCSRQLDSAKLRFVFVTAFVAVYDPSTRILRYARAGHDPPLLSHGPGSGIVERLDAVNGLPLGIGMRVDSGEASVVLKPGQSLVLYTDGITEAKSPDGAQFGMEGIERALASCNGEARCVVDTIVAALRAHEAGVHPRDDQTVVALCVGGAGEGITKTP